MAVHLFTLGVKFFFTSLSPSCLSTNQAINSVKRSNIDNYYSQEMNNVYSF